MKPNYIKPSKLPPELIVLLKSRGLTITDEISAKNYLTNIGYFRLSAYFYPLLEEPKNKHIFKKDATFDKVMYMYRFDRKLRLLLFNEIEKIEVGIRSAMTNIVNHSLNDVFWITDPQYAYNPRYFNTNLSSINELYVKSKQDFIQHFKDAYSNPYPPAWMIAEIVPLGLLCRIYRNLASIKLKKEIAKFFGLTSAVFDSWILVLGNLRNNCCHHSRIWNRENIITAHNPKQIKYPWINITKIDTKRIYFRICMIKYLLFTVSPFSTFSSKLKDLISSYPTIDTKAMGFPDDWEKEPLWK